MDEENKNIKHASKIAEAVSQLGDSDFGSSLGIGLGILGSFAAIAMIVAASKWDGHLYNRKDCVTLKEIKGQVYKVDTCTGNITVFKDVKE